MYRHCSGRRLPWRNSGRAGFGRIWRRLMTEKCGKSSSASTIPILGRPNSPGPVSSLFRCRTIIWPARCQFCHVGIKDNFFNKSKPWSGAVFRTCPYQGHGYARIPHAYATPLSGQNYQTIFMLFRLVIHAISLMDDKSWCTAAAIAHRRVIVWHAIVRNLVSNNVTRQLPQNS